jgi:hypothetical protein
MPTSGLREHVGFAGSLRPPIVCRCVTFPVPFVSTSRPGAERAAGRTESDAAEMRTPAASSSIRVGREETTSSSDGSGRGRRR